MYRLPCLCAALLLLVAGPAPAQEENAFFGAVAVGVSHAPDRILPSCLASNPFAAAEGRAGVVRGRLGVEARATFQQPMSHTACLHDPISYENGVYTQVVSPYGEDELLGTDLRVRYRAAGPVVLAAGGGWLWSHDLPYALVSAGLRAGGRVRLAVDVEQQIMRVTQEQVVREWRNFVPVRTLSRERQDFLDNGYSVRVGVEILR